jgi:glycosyltransferase involved in cell wall biosynthesis
MGLLFFPRGGSAHVARELACTLPHSSWDVTIVSGSLRLAGHPGDATSFYRGLDVHPVDFTDALKAPDPLLADPPFHPSYEDRPDAPDRVMAALDDAHLAHQVDAWAKALDDAGAATADVLHLHHLTPLYDAAARVAPDVPIVGHLHGTELLMLEAIEEGADWPYAQAWAGRLRDWATRCERILILTTRQADRAHDLLGIDRNRCVHVPNGFDPRTFAPAPVERLAHWHHHLVEDPQGWAPHQQPGSVSYTHDDLQAFAGDGPVLLYVGRFTAVKRTSLLIEAYAQAHDRFPRPAPLVLLGGFPGEWEGEHPLDAIARTGARDVFLAGWHGHDRLPDFLNASDAVVLPSVREQFGQVIVEGMACGLPPIAVDAHGPAEIVAAGDTGWLVPPDDRDALAEALLEAIAEPAERTRRGARARAVAERSYAWPALAQRVADVYEAAAPGTRRATTLRRRPSAYV